MGAVIAVFFSIFSSSDGAPRTAPHGRSACTKYAAPSGSDRHGRGTIRRPFRTVERLDLSLRAGQVGCLRAGAYGTPSSRPRLARAGVTLRSAPGEIATIYGAPLVTGAGTTLSHLRFDVDNVNHVLAVGEHCQPLGERTGAFSLEIEASNVTLEHSDVFQTDVAFDKRAVGIGVGWHQPVTGLVIRYNRVHDFGHCRDEDHSMYLDQVNGAQIYGNWIYNIPHGAGIQLWSSANDVHIFRNVIDHAASGISLGGYSSTSNNRIDHNVISNSVGAAEAGYPKVWRSGPTGSNARAATTRSRTTSSSGRPAMGSWGVAAA